MSCRKITSADAISTRSNREYAITFTQTWRKLRKHCCSYYPKILIVSVRLNRKRTTWRRDSEKHRSCFGTGSDDSSQHLTRLHALPTTVNSAWQTFCNREHRHNTVSIVVQMPKTTAGTSPHTGLLISFAKWLKKTKEKQPNKTIFFCIALDPGFTGFDMAGNVGFAFDAFLVTLSFPASQSLFVLNCWHCQVLLYFLTEGGLRIIRNVSK